MADLTPIEQLNDILMYDFTQIHKEYLIYVACVCHPTLIHRLVDWEKQITSEYWLNNFNTFVKYLDKKKWELISSIPSPEAIKMLRENPDKICWCSLSKNPLQEAIQLLCETPDKINWTTLCENTSPLAINMLRENPEKISWIKLSSNPSPAAIQLLRENPKKMSWINLSKNPSPLAIKLLRENFTMIDWGGLSTNPSPEAIKILWDHPHKIIWCELSSNPSLEIGKWLINHEDAIDIFKILENEATWAINYCHKYCHKLIVNHKLIVKTSPQLTIQCILKIIAHNRFAYKIICPLNYKVAAETRMAQIREELIKRTLAPS